MKRSRKNIDEEVEKTLGAFDGTERAVPKPFFFTRLQAKMESKSAPSGNRVLLPSLVYRLAIAFVIILGLFNLYSSMQFLGTNDDASLSTVDENSWVEEYYPQSNSLISLEDQ